MQRQRRELGVGRFMLIHESRTANEPIVDQYVQMHSAHGGGFAVGPWTCCPVCCYGYFDQNITLRNGTRESSMGT